MNKTVVALYDRLLDADAAVRELIAHGFSPEKISLLASDVRGEYSPYFDDNLNKGESKVEAAGVEIGTMLGGLGGLLVGLGLVAIPGIGPARRKALLTKFGSIDKIKTAEVEELIAIPGITGQIAQAIKSHLE